jgi:hypothetical protein
MAQNQFGSAYTSTFTVRNISQNNINATTTVVQPGDILMYQVQLSGSQPVTNEVIRVRTGQLAGTMTLVDSTDGRAEGSYMYFPTVTDAKSRWERTFAFYVRIESVPRQSSITMNFNAKTLTVNLSEVSVMNNPPVTMVPPQTSSVPTTGADYNWMYVLMSGLVVISVVVFRRRV